jgi:hypothetical protein
MSKSTPILVSLCIVALGFSGYEGYQARDMERQLSSARDASAKQEKRASAVDTQIRVLQEQLEMLKARTDSFGRFVNEVGSAVAASNQGQPANSISAETEPVTKPDDGAPVPASQVLAVRRITPLSDEELGRRIGIALQRTPETLTPVSSEDLANMPKAYEWGSGDDRRMWRLVDANTYEEVYPDGSYSVFPILGRAVVNDIPGVITTKDDGSLDVFIPDKGGRMVHLLRGASPGALWTDYRAMLNVD